MPDGTDKTISRCPCTEEEEEEEEFILQTCIQNFQLKNHVMDGYQKGHMAIQAGGLKNRCL